MRRNECRIVNQGLLQVYSAGKVEFGDGKGVFDELDWIVRLGETVHIRQKKKEVRFWFYFLKLEKGKDSSKVISEMELFSCGFESG